MDASHTDPSIPIGAGATELNSALGWRFFAGLVTLLLGILNLLDAVIAITPPEPSLPEAGGAG
jgi:hypothetical protein